MIKYLFLDIDGTLTDGGIYYDENGNQLKKFSSKDGTGIILAKTAGIIPVVVTGRTSQAVIRRMTELGITNIYQGVKEKTQWLKDWMKNNGVCQKEFGYIGDDVNDIGAMKLSGFVACPADAVDEVKEISDYVSTVNGGAGVVRDVIRNILFKHDLWTKVLNEAYGTGV